MLTELNRSPLNQFQTPDSTEINSKKFVTSLSKVFNGWVVLSLETEDLIDELMEGFLTNNFTQKLIFVSTPKLNPDISC